MPRVGKLFKKRKNVGWHRVTGSNNNNQTSSTSDTPQTPSTSGTRPTVSSCKFSRKESSASKRKLTRHSFEYNQFEDNSFQYDIVDFAVLSKLISDVAVCKQCGCSLKLTISNRVGLAYTISLECENHKCEAKVSQVNSAKATVENSDRIYYDINLRFVYALRTIGIGQETGRTFAGVMNFNQPSKFDFYNKVLLSATQKVCVESMKEAVEEAVKENDGCRDIAAAFDGSWQKRGFSSLNGVLTATSITTGQVLDCAIFSKYCVCKLRFENKHSDTCIANYAGTSGGMEVEGVRQIFNRSIDNYSIRYKYYLGDGDSKGFSLVSAERPYGDDLLVEKLECLGHVQKRMGSRLRAFKQKNSKVILSDGKTIGGRGRLTNASINTIQLYYGLAIRRNAGEGVSKMQTAIWATYFHLCSTNENPQHNLCPKDENTWCKYQKSILDHTSYDHNEHTHLPEIVMLEIKHHFRELANPVLLAKCTHGGTQNVSESLNNIIWTRIPKKVFVRIDTLKMGIYDAVSHYNKGNVAKCLVFRVLGLNPGKNCVAALKKSDTVRVQKAENAIDEIAKKCRQATSLKRKVLEEGEEEGEDPDNPSYAPGQY